MSDQAATTADAGKSTGRSGVSKEEQEVERAAEFTVDELKAQARKLFGASKHAVAGALSAADKELWTVEEAARKIEHFLRAEVEPSQHSQAQGRTV